MDRIISTSNNIGSFIRWTKTQMLAPFATSYSFSLLINKRTWRIGIGIAYLKDWVEGILLQIPDWATTKNSCVLNTNEINKNNITANNENKQKKKKKENWTAVSKKYRDSFIILIIITFSVSSIKRFKKKKWTNQNSGKRMRKVNNNPEKKRGNNFVIFIL